MHGKRHTTFGIAPRNPRPHELDEFASASNAAKWKHSQVPIHHSTLVPPISTGSLSQSFSGAKLDVRKFNSLCTEGRLDRSDAEANWLNNQMLQMNEDITALSRVNPALISREMTLKINGFQARNLNILPPILYL